VAKQHHTVLITHQLTQDQISHAPSGMLLTPDITPERQRNVVMELLRRQGTLRGKKVGVLAESGAQNRIRTTILPGVRSAGGTVGTIGVLTIAVGPGAQPDTAGAIAQLQSYIEHW